MIWGRAPLRHAFATVVALGVLLLGGLLPPAGVPAATAAGQAVWDQKLAPVGSAVWVYGTSPPGKPG